jgi:hypothetical protein
MWRENMSMLMHDEGMPMKTARVVIILSHG